MSADFFRDITAFSDFRDVINPAHYHAIPGDWLVAIADVAGSTRAIQEGRYKDVNVIGASSIIAVLNATAGTEIPYVFGGDGASFIIPPQMREAVANALQGTKEMAQTGFGMTLRAGLVPMEDIRRAGHNIVVAKYNISEHAAIAMFDGGGMSCAEYLVKSPDSAQRYDSAAYAGTAAPPADFRGLECRWNPLKARKGGNTLSLLARAQHTRDSAAVYDALLEKIREIYGAADDYRPARTGNMNLTFNPRYLRQEFEVHTSNSAFAERFGYAAKLAFEAVIGTALFTFDLKAGNVDGKQYVVDAVLNTDFQKFDDMLRMVIDSTPQQTETLKLYLDQQYEQGRLFYGTHTADAALLTCLIFSHHKKHIHFIDGASGGYAMAAQKMKEQMKEAQENPARRSVN